MTSTAAPQRLAALFTALLGLTSPAGLHAAAAVASRAELCRSASPDPDAAIRAIHKLPEVRAIERQATQRGLRMAFGPTAEKVRVAGQCRLSISVYVDHPDHWERRQTFLVDRRSTVTHAANLEGEYVTLRRWRAALH